MLRDHEFAAKAGSVGRPLPCMEARVVDGSGAVLAADLYRRTLRGDGGFVGARRSRGGRTAPTRAP